MKDEMMYWPENLPDDPTLSQIVEAVWNHRVDNPSHGVNCACLDTVLRIVRRQLTLAPTSDLIKNDDLFRKQMAVRYVFHAVVSRL